MADDMATPTQPWPRYAEWARMDSIASAIEAMKYIRLAMQHITDAETMRHLYNATEACHKIEVSLISVKGEKVTGELVYRANGQVVEEGIK